MPSIKGQTITVGVTGASGAVFAQKTLAMLEDDPRVGRVHLVVTETGQRRSWESTSAAPTPTSRW